MLKRKLFILGILLPFFIYSCSHDMEYDIPPSLQQNDMLSFSSDKARDFFEANATDLSSLYFSKEGHTKSSTIFETELIPEWDQIMESGRSGLRLFEIPIRSNASNVFLEKQFTAGTNVSNRVFISQRRLIIARKSNGETYMFITTLVPFEDSMEKANKSLESFRYLSCGNFTGRVYCSTLEGKFVKAFSITKGQLNGQLRVLIRTDFDKQKQIRNIEDYTVIQLHLDKTISTRTYSDNDECLLHGGSQEDCDICLDVAVVVGCSVCTPTDGVCTCDNGGDEWPSDNGSDEWTGGSSSSILRIGLFTIQVDRGFMMLILELEQHIMSLRFAQMIKILQMTLDHNGSNKIINKQIT